MTGCEVNGLSLISELYHRRKLCLYDVSLCNGFLSKGRKIFMDRENQGTADRVPGLRVRRNLPSFDMLEHAVWQHNVDWNMRRPDLEEREASVATVLGDDGDARWAVGLTAVHVHPAAGLHHLQCIHRHRLSHSVDTSTSHYFRLRNDLYCVGWGVKLYSITRHTSQSQTQLRDDDNAHVFAWVRECYSIPPDAAYDILESDRPVLTDAGYSSRTGKYTTQWRRLHRARGHVPPHLQMARHMGTVRRIKANKKLTKLCWPSRKRSPKRLIVLVAPKKVDGHDKFFFLRFAPDMCPAPPPHFQIRFGATDTTQFNSINLNDYMHTKHKKTIPT